MGTSDTTEERFELVADQIDHLEARTAALEDTLSDRAARRREWLVIWLFVFELLIGAAELYAMLPHHG